jgi:hypothetical protein
VSSQARLGRVRSTILTLTVPRNEVNHPTFLRSATHVSRKDLKYGEAFREASRRAQEAGAPLFIPTFTSLRRNIVEHLTRSLHRLEEKMSRDPTRSEENVLQAVKLLEHMGEYLRAKWSQLVLDS